MKVKTNRLAEVRKSNSSAVMKREKVVLIQSWSVFLAVFGSKYQRITYRLFCILGRLAGWVSFILKVLFSFFWVWIFALKKNPVENNEITRNEKRG
jgi:hypothetical protein